MALHGTSGYWSTVKTPTFPEGALQWVRNWYDAKYGTKYANRNKFKRLKRKTFKSDKNW